MSFTADIEGEEIIQETIGFTDSVSILSNADFPASWNKKVISTNSTMVSGSADLANFPVLVSLTFDTDLSTSEVGDNGEGIRFTSDGTNLLDFEIELYEGGSNASVGNYGNVTAWVRIPTLDYNDDMYFYIHYGQSISKASTAAGVWEDEPYQVVNHLSSEADTDVKTREIKGSRGDGNDDYNTENLSTAMQQVVGKIGKALDFDGVDDSLCINNVSSDGDFDCADSNTSTLFDTGYNLKTISLWYRADNFANNAVQMLFDEGGGSNGINMYIYNSKI